MARRIVIGDIHGCYKTLKSLLEEKVIISPMDDLYFLGDYIDRGPSSRQVLEYIIDLKEKGFKIHPLRGNHEDMFIKAFGDARMMQAWFSNGAEATLGSFGVPEEQMYDFEALKSIPGKIVSFIQDLDLYYNLEDYIIVHAGLNFAIPDIFEDQDSMLWIREMHYDSSKVQNKAIIHGHTPMPAKDIQKNLNSNHTPLINLDAGCVYKDLPGYGNLAALDLDSHKLYLRQYIDGD